MTLGVTLGLAELAHAVDLAPIMGALIAGMAISESSVSHRIERELAPIVNLLVPVFFLEIGIDTELGELFHGDALALAGILLVVALVGKVVAGLAAGNTDKLFVGLAMIPRGEVGLIVATLGLRAGAIGQDVYAAAVLVVLVTTLVTPPLLSWRWRSRPTRADLGDGEVDPGEVPGDAATHLEVALRAVLGCDDRPPAVGLLKLLDELPVGARRVGPEVAAAFEAFLHQGGPRPWRLAVESGLLDRIVPELATAVHRAAADSVVDPLDGYRFGVMERAREELVESPLSHPEALLLAALALDVAGDAAAAETLFQRTAQRLGWAEDAVGRGVVAIRHEQLVSRLVTHVGPFPEEVVLRLAVQLETDEHARAACLLAVTRRTDQLHLERVDRLERLILRALQGTLPGRTLVEERIEAVEAVLNGVGTSRVRSTPISHLARRSVDELATELALLDPPPRRSEVRASAAPVGDGLWAVHVVANDRPGLIAATARVLADQEADILETEAVSWPDGVALSIYRVAARVVDPDALAEAVSDRSAAPLHAAPLADVVMKFDNESSPWFTTATVVGSDRRGLLAAVTAAFAIADVTIHAATISSAGGVVHDRFELVRSDGAKLDSGTMALVQRILQRGAIRPRRGRPRLG